jgi:F-type H+-transporting ATPase subunit a
VLWKAFAGAIAVIQAFIFALLTVLYFAMAGAGHGDEHDEHADEHGTEHKDLDDEVGHDEAASAQRTPVPAS